jgi:hypothetical protein
LSSFGGATGETAVCVESGTGVLDPKRFDTQALKPPESGLFAAGGALVANAPAASDAALPGAAK